MHAPRPDLAAMIVPLGRALVAAERPVLERHGLSMWGYVVLLGLADEPTRTQAALAAAIGADKTRIIPVLDDLQEQGLIERRPDPSDRRVRLLALTAAGRARRAATQEAIQAQEERLLQHLDGSERAAFLTGLQRLAEAVGEGPE